MSEYITIQVGQCGNQIGNEFWPLVLQEYGITTNNENDAKINDRNSKFDLNSFFHIPEGSKFSKNKTLSDLVTNKIKARAILIDMETGVISRSKSSYMKDIFDDTCIVTNYPGSGNNWAEGYCQHGPKFKDSILCSVMRAVEKCDCLHGFLLMFSMGGGTGSGLGTYVLQMLEERFPNIDRLVTCVYPIGTEDVVTCPYNMALATRELLLHATCVIPVENRSLLDIINRQTNKHSTETMNFIASCKPFQDMNSVIVNMLLNLTSGSRFPGSLNVDLNELSTNMVPFPRLHFLASGLCPLIMSSTSNNTLSRQNRDEIFAASCSRSNQLIRSKVTGPKSLILGTTLLGRGDFTMSDMRRYVQKLQSKPNFTPWSAKAMKIGLCDVPPIGHNAAMLSLFNATSVSSLFVDVKNQLMKLYNKRAHVHHYLQVSGFDESYFEESRNELNSTIESYREIEIVKPLRVPRLIPSYSVNVE